MVILKMPETASIRTIRLEVERAGDEAGEEAAAKARTSAMKERLVQKRDASQCQLNLFRKNIEASLRQDTTDSETHRNKVSELVKRSLVMKANSKQCKDELAKLYIQIKEYKKTGKLLEDNLKECKKTEKVMEDGFKEKMENSETYRKRKHAAIEGQNEILAYTDKKIKELEF